MNTPIFYSSSSHNSTYLSIKSQISAPTYAYSTSRSKSGLYDSKAALLPFYAKLETSLHFVQPMQGTDVFRLHTERDVCKGNTDIPKRATLERQRPIEPREFHSWEYVRSIRNKGKELNAGQGCCNFHLLTSALPLFLINAGGSFNGFCELNLSEVAAPCPQVYIEGQRGGAF